MSRKGQSTIEFAFVLFAFVFFLSLTYNAVVSFAVYQYLSYANFMAARAYQPARENPGLQHQAAIETMQMYVPGIQSSATQNTFFGFSTKRRLAFITGWRIPPPGTAAPFSLQFSVPFLTLPLGEEMRASVGELRLETSVGLGREPTSTECRGFFQQFYNLYRGSGGGSAPHGPEGMEDNGC